MEPNANIKLNKRYRQFFSTPAFQNCCSDLFFLKNTQKKLQYIHIRIAMSNDFQCKGRYNLSRISFPLATLQRTPAATVFYVLKLTVVVRNRLYILQRLVIAFFKRFLTENWSMSFSSCLQPEIHRKRSHQSVNT